MVKVIVVGKDQKKKNSNIKNFKVDELYKKCNLRKQDHFEKRHTWKMKKSNNFISLYAKDKGRANSENKYDLPPPLDNSLYYGFLLIIKHKEENLTDENALNLTLDEWEKFYEHLFGGFEDLNGEDSYSEEEEIPEHMKTSTGYSKEGGFIVSDGESDGEYIPADNSDTDNELSEDGDEGKDKDNIGEVDEDEMGKDSDIDIESDDEEEEEEDSDSDDNDDLGSELSEESYVDSDNEN